MTISLLDSGLKIIERIIPNPEERAKAKEKLLALKQGGELKKIEIELQSISDARAHDKQSYGGGAVDFLRGIVRPVITLSAFSFYVYSKYSSIPLTKEDYAIVGMILAFWFGGKLLGKDVQK